MAFHEVRFPVGISLGSSGGPERRTQIAEMGSGREERNQQWANSRRSYNAGYGLKTIDDLQIVVDFWEERRARLHGFRWRDWSDWKSGRPQGTPGPLDQRIGTGTGALATFQLVKIYGASFAPWTRTIAKPVAGSVRVAVAGVEKNITTHFAVAAATGIVTFTAGNEPVNGATVTAGYEFDVPVRFDIDKLDVALKDMLAGNIPSIPVVEIAP
ncbi:DUF2460 domain-containing protein [soil metagenome]